MNPKFHVKLLGSNCLILVYPEFHVKLLGSNCLILVYPEFHVKLLGSNCLLFKYILNFMWNYWLIIVYF